MHIYLRQTLCLLCFAVSTARQVCTSSCISHPTSWGAFFAGIGVVSGKSDSSALGHEGLCVRLCTLLFQTLKASPILRPAPICPLFTFVGMHCLSMLDYLKTLFCLVKQGFSRWRRLHIVGTTDDRLFCHLWNRVIWLPYFAIYESFNALLIACASKGSADASGISSCEKRCKLIDLHGRRVPTVVRHDHLYTRTSS